MQTEQYSLRDNTINFEVEIATAESLAKLSSEHLIALANYGLSSWAWRAGAKKTSDGKVFSVADVAKDLASVKSKDGEPLPADHELAAKLENMFNVGTEILDIPDDLTGPDAKAWLSEQALVHANEWCESQAEKHCFTWENKLDCMKDLPRFLRLRRLAITRNQAKAVKAGLLDLD